MTLRAVCYARVSSVSQRERDTIASQLRVLPDYIERQGWVLARPVDTYVDDGHTAKAGHLEARIGLAALLRDAAAQRFDVVAVVDLDRLTRSEDITERGAILGAFQRAGVRVASASSGQVLDLSTSIGDLFSSLQGFFAAEENRKRRERTVQGKLTAIGRGRKPSGPTPFGLLYDRASGSWALDPVRAPIRLEAMRRVAAGESCQAIAEDFEVRDLPGAPRTGWSRACVYRMMVGRDSVGEWAVDKARKLTMAVPAVATEELWAGVQAALIALRRRGLKRTKHVYLLEALARCAACGAPIAIRSATANPKRTNGNPSPAAYVCRARKLDRACTAQIVRCDLLDEQVWAALCDEIEQPELLAAVVADREALIDRPSDWAGDVLAATKHIERLDHAAQVALERNRRGLVSEAAMDAELGKIQRERGAAVLQLRAAEKAVRTATQRQGSMRATRNALQTFRAAMPRATREERQELVRALIEPGDVVLDNGRARFTFRIDLGLSSESDTVPGVSQGCRTQHGAIGATLRIRRVA